MLHYYAVSLNKLPDMAYPCLSSLPGIYLIAKPESKEVS